MDPHRAVFIDETWAKTNMAPLRGWAVRGQRLIGRAPFGHWMEPVSAIDGVDGSRFEHLDVPCWVL